MDVKKNAYMLILLLGLVSLFGDIAYEGTRGISGQYLGILGASATIIGLVSGLGEFLGYGLRFVSGYFADKTKNYWAFAFIGYGLIIAIPLLAFANNWQIAAALIILERIGKGLRSPARDTILSHGAKEVGRGWGFAIHEFMDQIGAIIGPLIFAGILAARGSYKEAFAVMLIPVILCVVVLFVARRKFPDTAKLEKEEKRNTAKANRTFWLYTLFIFLSVAGFASFQLIGYHLKVNAIFPDDQIPVLYAIAMGVDAIFALGIGKVYDKIGIVAIIAIPLFTLPIPFLAFTSSYWMIIAAVVLWGAVMGVHETIMRAAIADIMPLAKRGTAYGIFNASYGLALLFGGAVIGYMYDHNALLISPFVVLMQVLSIPIFVVLMRNVHSSGS
ncbi:Major Facilitator Superfamily protein [Candidatus Gugararchaeum adminiculabundum]|nr:Major Facilitator Superfamily protein [Candidatus Gugararchaeum adminiculabundum]